MMILDMDPGIDDAITLIVALRIAEIKCISIVSGNVDVKQASKNALGIVRTLGYNIPIYVGADKPLKREPFYAKKIHGSNGLANIEFDIMEEQFPLNHDIYKTDVILATGPLTNIATAIDRLDARLYVMGGIYNKHEGNVTRDAEFNFYVDPEAAQIVLDNMHITACGLDLTSSKEYAVDNDMLDKIYNINNDYAKLIYKLLKYPLQQYKYFNIHDLFALFSYIEPKIFEMKRFKVKIDTNVRGRCIAEENKNGNVDACIYADHQVFKRLFLDLLK